MSKHLQMLHSLHFVRRRKDGLFVHYGIADKGIFQLCDAMCGRLEAKMKSRNNLLAG